MTCVVEQFACLEDKMAEPKVPAKDLQVAFKRLKSAAAENKVSSEH